MKDRSCLAKLISLYNKMTHFVDDRKAVYGVYLNFSKTFDTLSHSILLEKLTAHGLDSCMDDWVKNCLDGQAQSHNKWRSIQLVASGISQDWLSLGASSA